MTDPHDPIEAALRDSGLPGRRQVHGRCSWPPFRRASRGAAAGPSCSRPAWPPACSGRSTLGEPLAAALLALGTAGAAGVLLLGAALAAAAGALLRGAR